MARETLKRPLTALIRSFNDGSALRYVFLGMLGLTVGTVGQDFSQMLAETPDGIPGSQRLEPAPMQLPQPGDQTRPYLPRTMPIGPSRRAPSLPGYTGPTDGTVLSEGMTFHLGPDGKASALGRIDAGAAARLQKFIEKYRDEAGRSAIGEVHLHSPGGSVSDALAMSRTIREEGISTVIPAHAYCASSCPLVLAGGLYRSAGEGSFIGVHQVYALPNATGTLQRGMSEAQTVSSIAQQLLVDMEVDLQVWVKAMATPPAQLYVFTPDELRRFNLANGTPKRTLPKPRPEAEI
ncbi:hypothetical protein ACFQ14_10060 [Pseudahrensia aquimaris]|uniref:ATP-dependent Clp protease proteolytic subunit n=1 Tax=Pseudahrensia aquimaris TaxID=744461 RepID=A0ABW3FJ16_9HYPH